MRSAGVLGQRRVSAVADIVGGMPNSSHSPANLRQMRILEFLFDATGGAAGVEIALDPLTDELGGPISLSHGVAELVGLGLVYSEESGAGYTGALLTESGVAQVEELRRVRENPVERNKAARDALLRWAYCEEVRTGHNTYLDRFGTSEYNDFHGAAFTAREIDSASAWLRDQGSIKGPSSGQRDGVLRPRITARGQVMVEQGASVNDPISRQSASVVIHGSVSGNLSVQSPGAKQRYTVTSEVADAVSEALAAVNQAIVALGLEPSARAELEKLIARASQPDVVEDPSLLRTILEDVRAKVLSGAATALGQVLVHPIGEILQQLPPLG